MCAEIHRDSWRWPAVFHWLQETGKVNSAEMYRTFNCGIGMVLVVGPDEAEKTLGLLRAAGESAWRLGTVREHDGKAGRVRYVG